MLNSVSSLGDSLRVGAVSAAKEFVIMFNAMADDPTSAVKTGRSEGLDGTLKTIEGIDSAGLHDFECLVVPVVADNTGSHSVTSSMAVGRRVLTE